MTSHPARILYVHNSADLYGASRSLLRLTSRLDRRRFQPLAVLPENGPLAIQLQQAGVETVRHAGLPLITRSLVRSWKLAWFPVAFLNSSGWLKRLIRERRIDLVHTNTGVMPTPAWAADRAGVPHVWHIRDWFQEFRGLWGPYSRYILSHSTRVLAVSEAIAAQFANRARVQVLHNGFDLAEFQIPREDHARAFRARWHLGESVVVGTVGRVKLVRKGQEVLIDAARELARRDVRAKFVIVGAPFPGNESHLAELQRRVHEYGLQDAVVFTGELPDPRPAYAAFDLFVLPSAQPEPFGGVVMEAMAMGVPVIATALGGSTDQVAEGVTGFLVPPNNAAALADRIEQLIQDPVLRRRMAEAGPQRIATQFNLDRMVATIESLYMGLLAGSRRGALNGDSG